MNEPIDEAFDEIERHQRRQAEVQSRQQALAKAQEFVNERSAAELSIFTLRKAFEMGYYAGYNDALKEKKDDPLR